MRLDRAWAIELSLNHHTLQPVVEGTGQVVQQGFERRFMDGLNRGLMNREIGARAMHVAAGGGRKPLQYVALRVEPLYGYFFVQVTPGLYQTLGMSSRLLWYEKTMHLATVEVDSGDGSLKDDDKRPLVRDVAARLGDVAAAYFASKQME